MRLLLLILMLFVAVVVLHGRNYSRILSLLILLLRLLRGPQASFKGTSVISEKPVFICFPEGVSLHWSTTMSSLNTSELCDTDELTISVNLMEIPLVSLVLYYFSRDLNGSASNEDIVNRLPHIEYRCLSSYSIFHKENTP
eukprot:GHVU01097520.1.p1 GENE.GHVU01097520.1~~GHVU01097520.1.p1  ORF type:complete len:141 (-),score=15.82 GHVU01097520.1:1976-2398(-)